MPDMPCMKGLIETKRRRSTMRQRGKIVSCPADKLLINRLSTVGFVPLSVYMGIRMFVRLGGRWGDVSSMPLGQRLSFVFWANKICWHSIVPDKARPLSWALRPDPLVVCPGLRFHRLFLETIFMQGMSGNLSRPKTWTCRKRVVTGPMAGQECSPAELCAK